MSRADLATAAGGKGSAPALLRVAAKVAGARLRTGGGGHCHRHPSTDASELGLEEAPAHLGRAVQVSGAQTINNYPAIFFQKKKQRRKKKELRRTVQNSPTQRLIWSHFRVTDCWARAILSNPATVARSVHGKRGDVVIEAPLPNPSRLLRPPPSRALPKILNPARSGSSRAARQDKDFFHINTRSLAAKFTRQTKNGSRRLKKKLKSSCCSLNLTRRFLSANTESGVFSTPSPLKP